MSEHFGNRLVKKIRKTKSFLCVGLDPHLNLIPEIFDLNNNQNDSYIFHAGTTLKNEKIYTSGGRVLGATARGASLVDAQKKVYALIDNIKFNGMQYRTDIGQKVLKKSSER